MAKILDSYFNHFRIKYLVKKPLLLFKVAKLYINNLISKQDILQRIEIGFDYKCNLDCSHCFAKFMVPDKDVNPAMSDEKMLSMISECVDAGVITVNFQGGEPTLSPLLFKAIKAARPHKTFITLTTNGTLLDETYLRRLYAAGVDQILFSIDSMIEEEHDLFRRQKGVFVKAMENLELARRMGFVTTISTTVSHANIRSEGIRGIIDYCVKNRMTLIFQAATPTGNWKGNFDILITKEDSEYISDLNRKYPFLRRDLNRTAFREGCPAVKQFVYITASGDVLACPFIHISLGNVRDKSVMDIRSEALKMEYFRRYHPVCLAAEDREFIDRYISKTYNRDHLPISRDNW